MKESTADTAIDLHLILKRIAEHDIEFRNKYPEIWEELQNGSLRSEDSLPQLLLKELSSFKLSRK